MATHHEHVLASIIGKLIRRVTDQKIVAYDQTELLEDLQSLQAIIQDPTESLTKGLSGEGYTYEGIDQYKKPDGLGVIRLAIKKGDTLIVEAYWTQDRKWTLDRVGEDEYKRPIFICAKSKPLPNSESSIRPFLKKIADDELSGDKDKTFRAKYIEPVAPFAMRMVLCDMPDGSKTLIPEGSVPKPQRPADQT